MLLPHLLRVISVSLAAMLPNSPNQNAAQNVVLSALRNLASMSIIGARLLINIRAAAERGFNCGTACETERNITNIIFAESSGGSLDNSEDEQPRSG